ncbi:tRNA (adenosine(37)-N6)-threonylcarbamoyltransferase complex dimerization subunit type 1 TsaB [Sulfurihydrogenibium sp.]|uniref:tRNA (adenosine(37)-N6)-threonylcarbamoyltransferase complex dimerization subunit type 1 TsaB n=1 Tax=Sulfurihydrogenibium sp. TaxID=2053621 RepID=UPI002630BF04|nr:tRNA (adenosine(37)-N6)-threonylcarbamoyltransferase complex dimerization subunit type 1 TsaB [Sulfurihydrogenibium sp.]
MYLSIDTFSDNFGVALFDEEKVYGYREYLKPKPFSEILIVEIDSMFKTLEIDKKNLKGVMVNIGLGSNTGLRVGVITAKTLSYTLNIPIYAYKTLDVMIYKYKYFCGNVIAVINIGKSMVAYKIKDQEHYHIKKFEEFLKILEDFKNSLVISKNLNIENSIKLKTSLALEGGYFCLENKNLENLYLLEPIYHD